jgi:hypothetical protein
MSADLMAPASRELFFIDYATLQVDLVVRYQRGSVAGHQVNWNEGTKAQIGNRLP